MHYKVNFRPKFKDNISYTIANSYHYVTLPLCYITITVTVTQRSLTPKNEIFTVTIIRRVRGWNYTIENISLKSWFWNALWFNNAIIVEWKRLFSFSPEIRSLYSLCCLNNKKTTLRARVAKNRTVKRSLGLGLILFFKALFQLSRMIKFQLNRMHRHFFMGF